MTPRSLAAGLLLGAALAQPAGAQSLNLGGAPGAAPVPIQITASQGIQWQQESQLVIATGDAKAVRGDVTITADRLIAHYRKKTTPAASAAATDILNQGGTSLYELEASGHVHIYTATDNAWADHAVYSMDDAVLVLTGRHLKLTTPQDTITARDSIEYYAAKRQAVARGNALIVSSDGRSIAADTLIGDLAAPSAPTTPAPSGAGALAQAGQLRKVEAIGHVVIRAKGDTVTGDTGVYLPQQGRARLGGDVHIIQGPNEMSGSDALLDTKTGIATLLAGPGGQVAGIITPSSATQK